jgi:hypothetical protein
MRNYQVMNDLDLSEVAKLEQACQQRRAELARKGPQVVEHAFTESKLWEHLEGVYGIAPDILEALHSSLSQVYNEASADELFDAQWLCDCNDRWSDLAAALQSKPLPEDGSPSLPLVFDEFKLLLFTIQRLALQNSPAFGDLGKSDEDALQDLAVGPLSLRILSSPGTNSNCLIYSLATGLDYKGLFSFDGDRTKICQEVRRKLVSVPGLHPREANGRKSPTAYLEHYVHSEAIVRHLLGSLPEDGLEIVVHARWCTEQSPAESLHLGCDPDEEAGETVHLYNWTGRGSRGYHYDLLV